MFDGACPWTMFPVSFCRIFGLADIELKVLCRGFYPGAKARLKLEFSPVSSNGFCRFRRLYRSSSNPDSPVVRASPPFIPIESAVSQLPKPSPGRCGKRQAARARQALEKFFRPYSGILRSKAHRRNRYHPVGGRRPKVSRNRRRCREKRPIGAEIVEQTAALRGFHERIASKAAVDERLADNLIPLMALLGGTIRISGLTDHIRANIHVCEKFIDARFRVDENQNTITVS